MKKILIFPIRLFEHIYSWEENHPYQFSGICALLFFCFLLFHSPGMETIDNDTMSTDNIQFIDIDTIQAAKRVVKKEISTDEADTSADTNNVERAVGTSDESSAVDLSFFPNIVPPRPVGRLKKLYPKIAKERDIEALVQVELLIAVNGKVKNVTIIGIRLSKALPKDIHTKIAKAFAQDALKIFMGAQFSPPIVNGKRVPIKMETPLKFRLY
jgi:hypothetical protein